MSLALTFAAGQRLTGAQLQSIVDAINTNDLTSYKPIGLTMATGHTIINTTTLASEPLLTLTGLVSGATYKMFCQFFYQSSTTADFKVGFACSGTSSTLLWSPVGYSSAATVSATADDHTAQNIGTSHIYGGLTPSGAAESATPTGTLYAGTGTGITFALQFAQGTLDAVNGTTLTAGSNLTLVRVA